MAVVADGKVVVIHFTATGEDGRLIESTRGKDPMAYLHGQGHIVPGLEAALVGKEPGDRLKVTLPPEQAYGVRKGPGPQAVPRKEFPRKMDLREGMPLRVPNSEGQPVTVWITRMQGSRVWIDVDHPLAGQTVTFDVEVVLVRDPYPEEIEHGHAHGIDGGHHH